MSNAKTMTFVERKMQTQIAIEPSKSAFVKVMPKTSPIAATQAVMLTDIVTKAHANVLEVELIRVRSARKFAWTHRVVVVKMVKNVYR